jgi:hypothetical protein
VPGLNSRQLCILGAERSRELKRWRTISQGLTFKWGPCPNSSTSPSAARLRPMSLLFPMALRGDRQTLTWSAGSAHPIETPTLRGFMTGSSILEPFHPNQPINRAVSFSIPTDNQLCVVSLLNITADTGRKPSK